MKDNHASAASLLRRLARVASPLLLCALPLACVAGQEDALMEDEALGEASQALGGWVPYVWGTTTNLNGAPIGLMDTVCFLNGVAGHLGRGHVAAPGVLSTARVGSDPTFLGEKLWAHGGATVDGSGARVWQNNPVSAGATCFFGAHGSGGIWESSASTPEWWGVNDISPPVKIANLDPNHRRQCFLKGVSGGSTNWGVDTGFARVVEVTFTNSSHPTTGWYIESNLTHLQQFGGRVRVEAGCMDFPVGTVFTADDESASQGDTTFTIASQPGIKACALTGIQGIFQSFDWNNGAVIQWPDEIDGTWKLKLSAGKKAWWACAQ